MKRTYTIILLFTLSGFLSQSYGQWQPHIIVPSIDRPAIFDCGDIDGDGDLDLGATSWGDGKVFWYRNNYPDTIWTPNLVDDNMSGAVGMVVVDVDGDDTLDLVSTAGSNIDDVVWYENKGGTPIIWEKWTIDPDLDGAEVVDVEDIDGDGYMDVVACGRQASLVKWYENDGSNPINWIEHIVDSTISYPVTVCIADIDNDDDMDVVACGRTEGEVVWYENDGEISIDWIRHTIDINEDDGTFNVDVGKIDADDYLDVVVTGYHQDNVYWCKNNFPDTTWTKHIVDDELGDAFVVHISDVDLDSDLDLIATGRSEGAVVWYENILPDSTWPRYYVDSLLTAANHVTAYDMDDDGDFDAIAAAWTQTSKIIWYENPIINSYAQITDFQVNENPGPQDEDQGHSCICIDDSGNFVIAWVDERNGIPDIYAQRYSSDGSALGTNFKVNDQGSVDNWYISISADGNGNFVITWADFRNGDADIYAQRYSSDGSALGTNFKVNDDLGNAEQGSPSISIDGNGNFVITWDDFRNGDQDIYAQRYSSDGSALGTNFLVNDQGSMWQVVPSISTESSGNFVITWEDWRNGDADIYAQRYASDGITLGSNFQVDDVQGFARGPSISTDSSGNFVITWTDFRNGNVDIYAQRYASDGSALGTNFRVDDDPGSEEQETSSISVDDGGNFVITWMDSRNGDYGDIYAQRYSSDGSALGTNFRVTNTSLEKQYDSDVKLWNNRIYNTWTDHRAGITKSDIWANVLDWNNPVGIDKNELILIPQEFRLLQNYPNPFNPETKIRYTVPQFSKVVIKVFDILGREIETLVNEEKPVGTYEITWYAENLPSGIYFYRLQADSFVETKKMVLLR